MSRLRALFSKAWPVTLILIGVNAAVFLALEWASGPKTIDVLRTLDRFGALVHHKVWEGQYWRLVTPMFLHFGLLHFGFNMYALLVLGRIVEPFLGLRRFAVLYFASGVSGCIASLLFTKGISVGASGAIFGLLGALLAVEYMVHGTLLGLLKPTRGGSVVPIILINLVLGVSISVIDNNAHMGGLAGGFAVGYYFIARRHLRLDHYVKSAIVLAVFMGLAAVGFAAGIRPPVNSWQKQFDAGVRSLRHGAKPRDALPYLERAVRANPKSWPAWFFLASASAGAEPPDWPRALEAVREAKKLADNATQQRKCALLHGECLERLDTPKVEEALEVYLEALAADPKARAVRYRAVVCALDLARYEQALELAEAGLKEYPRDVQSYLGIEKACLALGRTDRAGEAHAFIREYYEQEYRRRPSAYNANNLAWTYAEGDEELDKALHLAREAVKDRQDSPVELDTLAWVQYKRGQLEDAIEKFKKVVELDPQANYGHYHLAVVLNEAKRYEEALQTVRRALDIKRTFEDRWAAEALAKELEERTQSGDRTP